MEPFVAYAAIPAVMLAGMVVIAFMGINVTLKDRKKEMMSIVEESEYDLLQYSNGTYKTYQVQKFRADLVNHKQLEEIRVYQNQLIGETGKPVTLEEAARLWILNKAEAWRSVHA